MGGTPFALFPGVVRTPVLSRPNSRPSATSFNVTHTALCYGPL
jgi:hypothetical protein